MADQINIPSTGLWSTISTALNSMFDIIFGRTGWAQYNDTQYTEISPFSILADVDTLLPNNAGNTIDPQKPSDITSFYTGGKITGRNGDGITIAVTLVATPTNANTSTVEVWFDIGGAIGPLFRRTLTFPKGAGVPRSINFTASGYTAATWEANGATAHIRADNTADIHDINYIITRTHKAR